MVAVMSGWLVEEALTLAFEESEVCFEGSVEGWEEDSLISCSSHQSSSVALWMPHLVNHCLLPSGTKKCTFLCLAAILRMVGWLK